jgi:arsenite methyltransferase
MNRTRPNYGLDAPDVIRRFVGIGSVMSVVAVGLILLHHRSEVAVWFIPPLIGGGFSFLMTAMVMAWGSKAGKLRLRDRVLASLVWRGDERVLDVGCGHGLMVIGAAKRVPKGKAIGVDIWQSADQAGNNREATEHNAFLEGVAPLVEIRDGDARRLPFEDGSFDVVLSSWALHNIYETPERHRALEEILRVLKPGGQVLIVDIRHCREYATVFEALGLREVRVSQPSFIFVIPSRCVTGRKAN